MTCYSYSEAYRLIIGNLLRILRIDWGAIGYRGALM